MFDKKNIKVDNSQIFKCPLQTEILKIPVKYNKNDYKNEELLKEMPNFIEHEYILVVKVEYYQIDRKNWKVYSMKFGDSDPIFFVDTNIVTFKDNIFWEINNCITENVYACGNAITDIDEIYCYLIHEFNLFENK